MTLTNICIECGCECNAITVVEPGTYPEEGSVSICLYCGHISLFNADLTLREPTVDECLEIHQSLETRRLLAIRKMSENIK